jgi:hypothetical protein
MKPHRVTRPSDVLRRASSDRTAEGLDLADRHRAMPSHVFFSGSSRAAFDALPLGARTNLLERLDAVSTLAGTFASSGARIGLQPLRLLSGGVELFYEVLQDRRTIQVLDVRASLPQSFEADSL